MQFDAGHAAKIARQPIRPFSDDSQRGIVIPSANARKDPGRQPDGVLAFRSPIEASDAAICYWGSFARARRTTCTGETVGGTTSKVDRVDHCLKRAASSSERQTHESTDPRILRLERLQLHRVPAKRRAGGVAELHMTQGTTRSRFAIVRDVNNRTSGAGPRSARPRPRECGPGTPRPAASAAADSTAKPRSPESRSAFPAWYAPAYRQQLPQPFRATSPARQVMDPPRDGRAGRGIDTSAQHDQMDFMSLGQISQKMKRVDRGAGVDIRHRLGDYYNDPCHRKTRLRNSLEKRIRAHPLIAATCSRRPPKRHATRPIILRNNNQATFTSWPACSSCAATWASIHS